MVRRGAACASFRLFLAGDLNPRNGEPGAPAPGSGEIATYAARNGNSPALATHSAGKRKSRHSFNRRLTPGARPEYPCYSACAGLAFRLVAPRPRPGTISSAMQERVGWVKPEAQTHRCPLSVGFALCSTHPPMSLVGGFRSLLDPPYSLSHFRAAMVGQNGGCTLHAELLAQRGSISYTNKDLCRWPAVRSRRSWGRLSPTGPARLPRDPFLR